MAHAWKACWVYALGGSNPPSSAVDPLPNSWEGDRTFSARLVVQTRHSIHNPHIGVAAGVFHEISVRSVPMEQIIGWGYQGKSLEDLLSVVEQSNVRTVVDVRLTPISRKKGFSKTRLREALKGAGVDYVHARVLGNPKDNREAFAHPGTEESSKAHDRFKTDVLRSKDGEVAIHELVSLASEGNVLVLCFESDHSQCHRSLIIDAARAISSKP